MGATMTLTGIVSRWVGAEVGLSVAVIERLSSGKHRAQRRGSAFAARRASRLLAAMLLFVAGVVSQPLRVLADAIADRPPGAQSGDITTGVANVQVCNDGLTATFGNNKEEIYSAYG